MGSIQSVLLGVLQGLTEFLPVSSSGHLVLAQSLIPGFHQPGVLFDVLLHAGTLLAVLVYFRKDVGGLFFALTPGAAKGQRKLLLLILLATVPTAAIGLTFRGPLEALFHAPRVAACMLLVTGTLLWLSETVAKPTDTLAEFGTGRALSIGFVQGFAIVPGISRSGSTIAVATLLGVRAEDAARFSFLLSIPAVAGAVGLQLPELKGAQPDLLLPYACGVLAAFGSGLWAIRFLMAAIRKGRFRWFAVYCWVLGVGCLLLAG